VIEQIEAQLQRLVPVRGVVNWTNAKGKGIEREMALVKVAGGSLAKAKALADSAGARTVETTGTSFLFEVTDAPAKLDAFIEQMRGLGLVDVSRTGVAAISRGPEAM
jgi:acetolactate synthase-1/3 small subunit